MAIKSKANMSEEMAAYTQKISQSVKELRTSEGYTRMLKCMSAFHKYSLNNVIMILMQMPEATQVAGFSTWKKMKRFVKKGEHGIRIFAPLVRKVVRTNADSEETAATKICGFKLVSVFDISQTDGEPLPEVPLLPDVVGSVDRFEEIMDAFRSVTDYEICCGPVRDGAYGLCNHRDKTITLMKGMSEAQQIGTLAHEVAHSLLHALPCPLDTPTREIEAESVAYMVCAHFGLDTSAFSFEYLASWSLGMEDEDFTCRVADLQKTASKIISGIETGLAGDTAKAA